MNREIKFRGKRLDNGEWLEADLLQAVAPTSRRRQAWIFHDIYGNCEVDPATVGQFTGLYDSTKWEQLSEQEKQEFYNKHCSEDGRTVKYQNVDDVKRLWKGREIYEGDILSGWPDCSFLPVTGPVLYQEGCFVWLDNYPEIPALRHLYIFADKVVKIGNIHDNPNLLEVAE